MAQSNQRFALDLDDIERQLRETQLQSPAAKSDPLTELARIVGQNDPFKTLLTEKQQAATALQPVAAGFSVNRTAVDPHARAAPYAAPETAYADAFDDLRPLQQHRSRRGLVTVGVVLAVSIAAVSGFLMMRNRTLTTASGEPPIVKADSDPLKIKPENPGGVEIPNQSAQVYERGGPDKQTKVVNREEQPIDVQQAARAAQPPAGTIPSTVTPGSVSAGSALQPAPSSAVAALGEPRRVRTVSVRPDGTIVGSDQAASQQALPPAPAASIPAPPPGAARAEARSTTPTSAAPQNGPLQISPPVAQQPQRTQRTAAASAPDPAETTNAAGNFSVQLSVANSEETARVQFRELQRKFAGELAGRSPLIRAAEVNGKTIYRVRVGPMSKDDAGDLCTKLKSSGAACFVARN